MPPAHPYIPPQRNDDDSDVSNLTDHVHGNKNDDDDQQLTYEEWAAQQAIREEEEHRLETIAREDLKQQRENAQRLRFMIVIGGCIVCLLLALIIVLAITLSNRFNDSNDATSGAITASPTSLEMPLPTAAPTTAQPTKTPIDTLAAIQEEGILRCGIPEQPGFAEYDEQLRSYIGFDVDLCRAVAAAIFGEADGRVDFTVVDGFDRFRQLNNGAFDLLVRITTLTMERQVLEPLTRDMFAFSTPYMYSGLRFAGEEDFVVCAETPGSAGARFCDQTVICVSDSTTHLQTIQAMNPDLRLSLTLSATESIERFIAGTCNVIAGEPYQISEFQVRKLGYTGSSYYTGEGTFSKDPLAMATRSNDPKWSDFVNWVLQALLRAEEKGIDQASAFEIPTTNVFGEEYENMFVNAVDVVGNYAEIYERNLELVLPRQSQDQINSGTSGLLYSYPFGDVTEPGSGPTLGGTIDAIRSRGILHCGVSTRAIFANFDSLRESWSGFDVDFCRAIAAALFDGDHTKVIFTDLPASVRFFELQQGAVDVLSRITTVTLERDVREPNVGVGFSFSQPTFYDGMTFGGVPQFVDCADNLDVGQESFICRNLVICVNRDTTFEKRVNELFADAGIRVRDSLSQSILSLAVGECNVIAGGSVDVSVTSITSSNLYSGEYAVGVNRFSKDPLALVTRQDDFQWTQFVNWIVQALIYAEENGINQDTAGEMPLVEFFGPDFSRMFQHAVAAVGNYAELYDRNAGGDIERGGLNTLNVLLSGPQHYPFPGVI